MSKVLFVEYPKCSTCKKAKAWLDVHGVDYDDRHIVEDNPTAEELAAWQGMSGLPVRRFFNTSGQKYRALGVKARLDAGMTDEEAFALLATDGMLVKRPIVVSDGFVLVGFKEAEWEARLAEAAEALAAARAEAAPRFTAAVTEQMARLEMGGAQLECALSDLPRGSWTRAGSQAVEFLFRPGAGMQARPLARIASGGEISRVMLAVKVVLGQVDDVDTLVFDEVDAGVGGSTANALAEVLADLAQTHQVIVVTHLAQVAVRGQAHYVVRKTEGADGMPETDLRKLADDERPAEIARMLSGDATETSLAHAREMLAAAQR